MACLCGEDEIEKREKRKKMQEKGLLESLLYCRTIIKKLKRERKCKIKNVLVSLKMIEIDRKERIYMKRNIQIMTQPAKSLPKDIQ